MELRARPQPIFTGSTVLKGRRTLTLSHRYDAKPEFRSKLAPIFLPMTGSMLQRRRRSEANCTFWSRDNGMMHYRMDIDGLRAMAIIPVVLFHAGVPAFRGGFLGVDVFFVISGYLITRQLLETEARGWRRIFDFYERRVRRIAPAFIVMLGSVLLVITMFLPAADVMRTAKSTVAALFFAANFRFYGKTGYFDGAGEDEVLLHTWSLAIEEQFYLFFPLLLFLFRPKNRLLALTVLAVASIVVAQLSLAQDPAWAFYLLPARAWELLAGAMLATSNLCANLRGSCREVTAGIGLSLICGSIAVYDTFTPFPGVAALPPIVGAVLLLAAGEATFVGKLLSLKPLVGVGLISYSLYLWHWPIIVVSRQLFGPDNIAMIALIAFSLVISVLSFRYIERPFRNRKTVSWKRLFATTGAAAFIISVSSVTLIAASGWPQRSPKAEQYFQAASRIETAFQNNPCLSHGPNLPPLHSCILGNPESIVEGVLWGDSHAAHWAPMISAVADDARLGFRQITKAGCPPIPVKMMLPTDSSRLQCPEFNARAEQYILANPQIRYVVLAANWQGLTEGSIRVGTEGSAYTVAASRRAAKRALDQLAVTLHQHGKSLLIIGQTPIPDQNFILCQTRRRHLGVSSADCDNFSSDQPRMRDQAAQKLFADAVINADAKILSPFVLFCNELSCALSENSMPLYIDSAHLSPAGARKIESDFAKLLADSRKRD